MFETDYNWMITHHYLQDFVKDFRNGRYIWAASPTPGFGIRPVFRFILNLNIWALLVQAVNTSDPIHIEYDLGKPLEDWKMKSDTTRLKIWCLLGLTNISCAYEKGVQF